MGRYALRNLTPRCQRLALVAFQVVPPLQCHTQGTALLAVVSISPAANACLTPGTVVIDEMEILFMVLPRFGGASKVWLVHLLVAADQLQAGGQAGRWRWS